MSDQNVTHVGFLLLPMWVGHTPSLKLRIRNYSKIGHGQAQGQGQGYGKFILLRMSGRNPNQETGNDNRSE